MYNGQCNNVWIHNVTLNVYTMYIQCAYTMFNIQCAFNVCNIECIHNVHSMSMCIVTQYSTFNVHSTSGSMKWPFDSRWAESTRCRRIPAWVGLTRSRANPPAAGLHVHECRGDEWRTGGGAVLDNLKRTCTRACLGLGVRRDLWVCLFVRPTYYGTGKTCCVWQDKRGVRGSITIFHTPPWCIWFLRPTNYCWRTYQCSLLASPRVSY